MITTFKASDSPTSLPFTCSACKRKFTRLENLKRHMKLHSQQKYVCPKCGRSYSRSDSLLSHAKKIHNLSISTRGLTFEVTSPKDAAPDKLTKELKSLEEIMALKLKILDEIKLIESMQQYEETTSPLSTCSEDIINECLGEYWKKFDPYFPIIHPGSFRLPKSYENDLLVTVMCAIGARYIPERRDLSSELYEYVANKLEPFPDDPQLQDLQAILLTTYLGIYSGDDEWFKKTIRIYPRLVEFSRKSGIFQYNPNDNCDKDWDSFIVTETRKRFSFGLYLLDSHTALFFNYPPSLSHYELKHKLPCSDELWRTRTSTEWQLCLISFPLHPIPHFFSGLQNILIFGLVSGPISSFGVLLLLLSVEVMIRNMAQYAGFHAGFQELSFSRDKETFTRLSQLGSALNCLRKLVPKSNKTDVMWDYVSLAWNLAYIHLHLPDTVITSGVVEVTLNETIATASALARPQPRSPPGTALLSIDFSKSLYQTLSLTANHISYILENFSEDQSETSPVFIFMFYKAALVTWQILNAFKNFDSETQLKITSPDDAPKGYMMRRLVDDMLSCIQFEGHDDLRSGFFEKWVESVLASRKVWGIGRCAAASFLSLVSDVNL